MLSSSTTVPTEVHCTDTRVPDEGGLGSSDRIVAGPREPVHEFHRPALAYRPHPLLRSGHLQTLLVGLVGFECPSYNATPIRIGLDDGESMIVHEERGAAISKQAPLAILLHGLGGDHRSAYLGRLAPRLRSLGLCVWRVDLRGCGEGLKHAWRPANAGSSEDLAAVVKAAMELHPERQILIAGFSLSGNILLKMLGEAGAGVGRTKFDLARLSLALAIAPPINLHDCAGNMDRWSRRLYTHYYLKSLDSQVQIRQQHWPQWRTRSRTPKVRTIRQFDARYTAPLSGFIDEDDYYTQSSAIDWLPSIKTQAKILVDRDDPIVTARSFAQANPNPESTEIMYTRRGGHMGYFGIDERGQNIRWLEYFVAQAFRP